MKDVLLSIIIPTYNRAAMITRQLDVFRLVVSKVSYEIIVVDDGSTDNTDKVITGYTDLPIRYFFQNKRRSVSRQKFWYW